MIEKRKRMLKTFLNKVAAHPILRSDACFVAFLQSTSWVRNKLEQNKGTWSERTLCLAIKSPQLFFFLFFSMIHPQTDALFQSKRPYDQCPENPPCGSTPTTLPESAFNRPLHKILKAPDIHFAESEAYTVRFDKQILAIGLSHRKIAGTFVGKLMLNILIWHSGLRMTLLQIDLKLKKVTICNNLHYSYRQGHGWTRGIL